MEWNYQELSGSCLEKNKCNININTYRLQRNLYKKPTDRQNYLHAKSAHLSLSLKRAFFTVEH